MTNTVNPLEAALPSLVEKLKVMKASLSEDEKKVFGDIILSAAKHTEALQAAKDGALEKIRYMKPMSVHGTEAIRDQFIKLPQQLKIDDK
jgi:hypothetical protein